jgi:peptidoglycan-associated lipoprotein
MRMRLTSVLSLVALVVVSACRSQKPPAPVVPTPVPNPGAAGGDTAAERLKREAADRAAREAAMVRAKADSAAAAKANAASAAGAVDPRTVITSTIFFDYDASDIRDDARPLLEAKVPVLAANPGVRIRISGHADDRGSDEYNLALGQRRAAALKRWLGQRGIGEDRILLASYGEERPACANEDETCWVKNRRAEFEIVAAPATLVVPR